MKILIIGAGPVGCYLAHLLKKKNRLWEVLLLEEHQVCGEPLHCAGLVSRGVFENARLKLPQDSIVNHIESVRIFLNGKNFQVRIKDKVVVLDRKKFDYDLSLGLDIKYNNRFMGVEKSKGGYLVQTDRGDIYADIVIGADGANSLLRRIINPQDPIQYFPAAQLRLETSGFQAHEVRVYLRKPLFSWVIPESANIVRVGVIAKNPYHDLAEFMKTINLEGQVLEKFGGILPLGKCKTSEGGLALVGDAACQVKPLTHGGIYYGMRCAEILCDSLKDGRINEYEIAWEKEFGREMEIGLKAKRVYEELDEKSLLKIFNLLEKNKGLLEKFASFDRHSDIILKLIKVSQFQRLLGKLLLKFI